MAVGTDKAAADKAAQEPSKLPADEAERRRKVLLSEINRIDNRANAAADNGLFDKLEKDREKNRRKKEEKQKVEEDDLFQEIQDKLRRARNELYSGNFAD